MSKSEKEVRLRVPVHWGSGCRLGVDEDAWFGLACDSELVVRRPDVVREARYIVHVPR